MTCQVPGPNPRSRLAVWRAAQRGSELCAAFGREGAQRDEQTVAEAVRALAPARTPILQLLANLSLVVGLARDGVGKAATRPVHGSVRLPIPGALAIEHAAEPRGVGR